MSCAGLVIVICEILIQENSGKNFYKLPKFWILTTLYVPCSNLPEGKLWTFQIGVSNSSVNVISSQAQDLDTWRALSSVFWLCTLFGSPLLPHRLELGPSTETGGLNK